MSAHAISSIETLREVYGSPPPDSLAVRCVLPGLDTHHRAFIALSPFLVMASADAQGMTDVSPRGDLPGFVAVLDEHTLLIPDRPGNKKLVTLSNIVENPHVALIFFVPGRVDSLRVTGQAEYRKFKRPFPGGVRPPGAVLPGHPSASAYPARPHATPQPRQCTSRTAVQAASRPLGLQ
jgi:predicted pyridoxine 5'-phosphate oxidase superfamily flavin-nucleotide-binding protein